MKTYAPILPRTLMKGKKIIPIAIVVIMLLSMLALTSASVSAFSGSGTSGDPYIITTVDDLQAMKNNLNAHYALGNDIDASVTKNWNGGAGFEPIGPFTGSFDGQGYKIVNLYINRPSTNGIGLFGFVYGGAVKNVGLESVNVHGNNRVGGLVGRNYGTVSDSYSTGSVSGDYHVGGLVGYNSETVSNSYSTGTVSGYRYVGGLAGGNRETVSNSYSTGTVNGNNNYYVGGLVGINYGTVSDSYSTGSVSGIGSVGGLVGSNFYGTVSDSYSTGTVNGNNHVGGLVGQNQYNDGPVSDSYWDIETSGQTRSAGGTGKTTEEMKNVRTYTDTSWSDGLASPWDFVGNPYDDVENEDSWDIDGVANDGYPFLSWQVFESYNTPPASDQASEHANENSAVQQGIPANNKAKENANENAAFNKK